jgi:hypothetical protein
MVPLVDIGDNIAPTSDAQKPADSFSNMFKKWNTGGQKGDHGVKICEDSDIDLVQRDHGYFLSTCRYTRQ